jgi:hypothetical protein
MKDKFYFELLFIFVIVGLSISFSLCYTNQTLIFLLGMLCYSFIDAYLKKDL